MEILPSVMSQNFGDMSDKVAKVVDSVKWIQIDVMDGVFTPTKSWPYTEGSISDLENIKAIRTDDLRIDVHLMVKDPEEVIPRYVEFGADRIVFQYESTKKYSEIIKSLDDEEVELYVSLLMDTPVSVIDELIGDIDGVRLMSVRKIGHYGQPFDKEVLEKIKEVKEKYPGLPVSVDGGVDLENIESLIEAGAEDFVVGSAIFGHDDPKVEIEKFKALTE